ncbi:MAG: cobalt-precorrin-6A reductase [Hyphomicrobiaceae bacterium]
MTRRILLLGGTTEARKLAERLGHDARFETLMSLAGRTRSPKPTPVTVRVGGFGGVDGLIDFLAQNPFDVVVDATHPFAVQMSANAAKATARTGIDLLRIERAEWTPVAGDKWTSVACLEAATNELAEMGQRVFLGVGRQSLAPFANKPQHHYVIRVIDPPDIPAGMTHYEIITGLGPFRTQDDIELFRAKKIDVVVTKNSGGKATASKIAAARELALPVIMIERPKLEVGTQRVKVPSVDKAMAWLEAHYVSSTKRSV